MSFLYDHYGKRKYLTVSEREAFLLAAKDIGPEVYTFCVLLAFTGMRISEALATIPSRIDFSEGVVLIESLKKRRRGLYRAIPVPSTLLRNLDDVHGIRQRQVNHETEEQRLWPWSRTTAWKCVKQAMAAAGIVGPHACPRGLRHSFGVTAVQHDIPLNMIQKWLGHSNLKTTAIYADAVGEEERAIAHRLWGSYCINGGRY